MKKTILLTGLMMTLVIASAQIINVPADYPTIQQGIDAAQFFNDTVLVDEGTYYENINFNGKLITVASHYIIDSNESHIDNTIINGSQPSNPDRGSVVYIESGEDTTSVLCGFTITKGTGTLVQADDIRAGGGIFILNSGAKILSNKITDNEVQTNLHGSGGGITVGDAINNNNYVIIKHNEITNNNVESFPWAEGGGMSIYSNAIIEDNIITNNQVSSETENVIGGGIRAMGVVDSRYIFCNNNTISNNTITSGDDYYYPGAGGMQVFNCFGKISNNTIQNNVIEGILDGGTGGGIHFRDCGLSMILENNIISENVAGFYGGGVCLYTSNIQIINNIIAENSAERGAGIDVHFNLDGIVQVINNTIAFNVGSNNSNGIFLEDADAVVLNTILWNYGNEIDVDNGNVEVAYSNVWGGWDGDGNINEDPSFFPDDPYFHINCGSCWEAGIGEYEFENVTCYAPDHDIDGDPRPLQNAYDIGADETLCPGINEYSSKNTLKLLVSPNPSIGNISIQYSLEEPEHADLSVINMNGSIVFSQSLKQQLQGANSVNLDLSHLPDGLYVVKLQTVEKSASTKIIINK